MKSNKRTMKNKEKGAALVEFALSVPVLFLFFSGVLEFGNILSQLTWVSQAGYTLAAVGAESPQGVTQSLLNARLAQLVQAKDFERFRNKLLVTEVTPAGTEYFNNNPLIRTITIKLKAQIIPISNLSFGIPVDINITAPQLVENTLYDSNYGVFGQPQPEYFACNGATAGFSPPTADCRKPCGDRTVMGSETCAWV
jgi:hypothetical protein